MFCVVRYEKYFSNLQKTADYEVAFAIAQSGRSFTDDKVMVTDFCPRQPNFFLVHNN